MWWIQSVYLFGFVINGLVLIYREIKREDFVPPSLEHLLLNLFILWYWPLTLMSPIESPLQEAWRYQLKLWRNWRSTAGWVRVVPSPTRKISGVKCTICAEGFVNSVVKKCPSCDVLLHPECLEFNGGSCGIYGCTSTRNLECWK